MDPLSTPFIPRDDIWKFQTDLVKIHKIQLGHSERLNRLEQRQDEDSRTKSIWGPSSPFPSLMGHPGTPHPVPVQQSSVDTFSDFDDQPTHLIGSLQLDADDEPRRLGTASRANSVRFAETTNLGHWSHANRSSLDLLLQRSSSSLGAHSLVERTSSHKSDGRQSSAGQSVHSLTSRANSMGIDTLNGLGAPTPTESRVLTPGLFHLGAVPAIIRCWLTTAFKHEALLYAAVCTGSYASFISYDLIRSLKLTSQIRENDNKIELAVYLPEASVRSTSSRSNSPAQHLPNITIEFNVVYDCDTEDKEDKSIRIVIGSDVLTSHNADILFSTKTMTLYDDDKSKLSMPLIRPEDVASFRSLRTMSKQSTTRPCSPESNHDLELQRASSAKARQFESSATSSSPRIDESPRLPSSLRSPPISQPVAASSSEEASSNQHFPQLQQPSARSHPSSSPAAWGNWRQKLSDPKPEWPKSSQTYHRGEKGFKILRSGMTSKPPPASGLSRSVSNNVASHSSQSSEDSKRNMNGGDGTVRKLVTSKDMRSVSKNPVGEGSAFSWMKQ